MRNKRGPAPTCAVDDCDESRLIWLYLFANFAWTGARVALVVSCVPDRCETCEAVCVWLSFGWFAVLSYGSVSPVREYVRVARPARTARPKWKELYMKDGLLFSFGFSRGRSLFLLTNDAQRCDRSASTGCCGQNILSRLTPRLIPSSVQACPRSKEFGCVVYGSMILAPPTCLGAANVPWVIFRWMLCARGGHCLSSQYILIQLRPPSSSHSQLVVSTRRSWNDATRALSPGGGRGHLCVAVASAQSL
jgi:hypothetical protein